MIPKELNIQINTGSLNYHDITPTLIEEIHDIDIYTALALYWKQAYQGQTTDIQYVLVKLAFYRHYLYKDARSKISLYNMHEKWI